MRRTSLYSVALLAALLVFSGCGKTGTSTLPSAAIPNGTSSVVPQVWERGTPPVQWAIFAHPASSTHYAFPVADRANHMWFESDNKIERINFSGSNLGTLATITSEPLGNLTLGGDGNIWYVFTSNSPNPNGIDYVYAANSSGTIQHEYKLAGTGGVFYTPVIFPGNGTDVWVGRSDTDAQGAITGGSLFRIRNGQVQQFPCPTGDVPLAGAVTPDGRAWFTGGSPGGYNVDVMDPTTGNCHMILGTGLVKPGPMVLGPDHNPWLIDTGDNGSILVRINAASQTRSNFGVGLHYTLKGLTVGPDGNLWTSFTTSTATGLFQVSPSGTVLGKFTCPTSFCANQPSDNITQLTTAPDGNVWFAYNGVDSHAGLGAYVRMSMTITPSSVAFSGVGQTQLIKIAEANYSGTWSVASTNTSVVQVVSRPAPNEALLKATGPGKASVTVTDSKANFYDVTVTVP